MRPRVNASGLVIAGVGFFLTRFTVALALYEDPVRFLMVGIVPLVLGLGLAAFGVALAVADVEPRVVRTTAAWCVAGTGAMLALALLTLLGEGGGRMSASMLLREEVHLSTFLIGGSVGGTLTGLYAAGHGRQREELRQQANRLEVLNRLLRHEVLNGLTVIRGYAELGGDRSAEAGEVIRGRADGLERTIDEVKYLTRTTRTSDHARVPVDVAACLEASVERVRRTHPGADVAVDAPRRGPMVLASDRLELVLAHLLENAIDHAPADDPRVEVAVEPRGSRVRVSVRDGGHGLPDRQRSLLERGDIERYDDPQTGFGLNVVRLFVESFRGDVETAVDDDGTTITVVLDREREAAHGLAASPTGLAPVRVSSPHLLVTLAAGLAAGVVYGAVSETLGGSIAGIGVFYGTADPLVGWITHEFHSVVFAIAFVGLVSLAPASRRGRLSTHLAVGAGWGVVLWLLAAGLVAPVWLRLLGIPAGIPNLTVPLLAAHLAWGVSLGALAAVGYERVVPRLVRLGERAGWRRPERA